MNKPRYSWKDLVFLLAVAAVTYFVIQNKTTIQDWWYFRSYQPPPAISDLADASGMSAHGQKLFFRTNPQLVDRSVIEAECSIENLGCITEAGQVYILNEPSRGNEMIVTAAHEMLHLAYQRLTKSQRGRVNQLLENQLAAINNQALIDKLAKFTDPEERLDELHSYLGTEHDGFSQELEDYYEQYFSDRTKVVEAYRRR